MDKQECIERQLESALLEGRWGVFERLPSERGLAEAFGVNRATVRAALRALAGRGILETRRGSGTVVRVLPGDARHAAGTFADYLAAFRILMPPLVAASLPAVSPSVILELERLLPSAGASLRNGDMKTFIQAQIRFFSILIRVLGNPRLEDAATMYRDMKSKDAIRDYLVKNTVLPYKFYTKATCVPPEAFGPYDANTLIPRFTQRESIKMIVSGGPGKQSQFWVPFPQVLKPVSAKIAE